MVLILKILTIAFLRDVQMGQRAWMVLINTAVSVRKDLQENSVAMVREIYSIFIFTLRNATKG